jgi:hypothetical protein
MALEPPKPGQVIHYAYLWWNEARRGQEEGRKDRPCGVVLARALQSGVTFVYALPITHRPALAPEDGVEIPFATRRRLGLDEAPSWMITTELNRFAWPGPDVRSLPAGGYSYGFLPGKLLRAVLEQVRAHARDSSIRTVDRDT